MDYPIMACICRSFRTASQSKIVVKLCFFGVLSSIILFLTTHNAAAISESHRPHKSRQSDENIHSNDRHDRCSTEALSQNDTDENILNACQFATVSMDSKLDKDIFNLKQVNLPLLKQYRNPCWYEKLPENTTNMYIPQKSAFKDQAKKSYHVVFPIMQDRIQSGHLWRLRCLPLVYIIGVAKCGTTDIFENLKQHPFIVKGATKEPMFWNFSKWRMANANIRDYLDLYDEAAEKIRKTHQVKSMGDHLEVHHPVITVDASVSYLFRFEGKNLKVNKHSNKGPVVLTPHFIKHVTPDARVILMVRNPTERLYSEYLFFRTGKATSVEEFDVLVREAIHRMNSCLAKTLIRSCIYDEKYAGHNNTWVRLVAGMYAPFIKDWQAVFPHMMIIRTEDYHDNRAEIYQNVLEYIGLDVILPEQLNTDHIVNKGHNHKEAMLPQTRTLLDNFYKPFNADLAKLLKDKSFLFEDS